MTKEKDMRKQRNDRKTLGCSMMKNTDEIRIWKRKEGIT